MENHLDHLAEFKKILANYEVSPRAKKSLISTKLVLLVGPTASGRNTLINYLVNTGKYNYIVSDTTRKPRINNGQLEQNGREYWFRTETQFLGDLKKGELLEAEIIHNQQVSGVSIRELEKAVTLNKVSITDVDLGGINRVIKSKPDVIAILLLPPSFREWQNRIKLRGEINAGEYRRRMQTAERIFTYALTDNRLIPIISDSLQHSSTHVDDLVNGIKGDFHAERELIKNLLYSTKELLD